MKRTLRRILLIGISLIAGLFLLLLILPFFFQDELKGALKTGLNQQLNATVEFEDLGLSFIRSFPDATISLEGYSIANHAPFEGDTLVSGKSLALTVNLMSIFRGEEYQIRSVSLDDPKVYVHVLPDGQANYDITLPSETIAETDTTGSSFNLALESYRISNGNIRYADESLPMNAHFVGLDHEGNGNFTDTDFLLETTTAIRHTSVTYDGSTYLNRLPLSADANLNIHNGEVFGVTLEDNRFLLNQFPLEVTGSVQMPGDDINLDLIFSSPGSNFETLLSLVPEVFKTDLAGFRATGDLVFSGNLKGTYSETSFPGYGLNLQVNGASIQYPDLPESITGVGLDLSVNNADGRDESLIVDLKQLQAKLGQHPLSARLHLENLVRPRIDGEAKASLNLADLASVYPIEGTELAGQFDLDAQANGVYDEAAGTFPAMSAEMSLKNGLIRSQEYDTKISDFFFEGTAEDATAQLADARVNISDFRFLLDGVPMAGKVVVENFDNPQYVAEMQGELDLGKLFQLYPIDSMELSGLLKVNDLYAAGSYSDIEAERYDQLTNRGSVEIESLFYRDLWYTQPGVTLTSGSAQFSPDRLSFQNLTGKLGKSSFSGSGYLTNYLAYLLMGSEELQGNISMSSPSFDLNEWLAEDPEAAVSDATASGEEEPLEVYPIPAGYDLVMNLNMSEVLYDDLTLKQVSGTTEIKDQQMLMEDVKFNMLGSNVVLGGAYDTRNPKRAGYDFFLDIDNLLVKEAFKYFSVVQGFAPVAAYLDGKCNLEVGLKGGLMPDFTPILDDLDAFGLFELLEGGLSQTPLTNALAANTNISQLKTWNLRDLKGIFQIEDGTLTFDPIDVKLGDIVLSIGGAQNLAGNIRYNVAIDAPTGTLGTAAFQSLSQLTGASLNPGERVNVNLLVTGTAKEPKVEGAGGGTGSMLKNQATAALESTISEQTGVNVPLNKDSLTAQAAKARQQAEDSLRALGQQAKQQARDTLTVLADSAKIRAQQALEEELKQQAGEEVTEKLKELKKRIKIPGRK